MASARRVTERARSHLLVVPGPEDVAQAALEGVVVAEREALARSGTFRIALAGGSTPRRLYQLLASRTDLHFAQWIVGFGDERWVSAKHPESNFGMAREALLAHVPIPERQVLAVDTAAGTSQRAAFLYSIALRRALAPAPGMLPRFDLVLLGLGADGHTASLFPDSSALTAPAGKIAVATWAPAPRAWRVTLTAEMVNAAREVLFVVSGMEKSKALARVMDDTRVGAPPAATIHPRDGKLSFVVDEAAAQLVVPRSAKVDPAILRK